MAMLPAGAWIPASGRTPSRRLVAAAAPSTKGLASPSAATQQTSAPDAARPRPWMPPGTPKRLEAVPWPLLPWVTVDSLSPLVCPAVTPDGRSPSRTTPQPPEPWVRKVEAETVRGWCAPRDSDQSRTPASLLPTPLGRATMIATNRTVIHKPCICKVSLQALHKGPPARQRPPTVAVPRPRSRYCWQCPSLLYLCSI